MPFEGPGVVKKTCWQNNSYLPVFEGVGQVFQIELPVTMCWAYGLEDPLSGQERWRLSQLQACH